MSTVQGNAWNNFRNEFNLKTQAEKEIILRSAYLARIVGAPVILIAALLDGSDLSSFSPAELISIGQIKEMSKQDNLKLLPKDGAVDEDARNYGYIPDVDAYENLENHQHDPDWQRNTSRLHRVYTQTKSRGNDNNSFCQLVGINGDGNDHNLSFPTLEFYLAKNPFWLKAAANFDLFGILPYLFPENLPPADRSLNRDWVNRTEERGRVIQ